MGAHPVVRPLHVASPMVAAGSTQLVEGIDDRVRHGVTSSSPSVTPNEPPSSGGTDDTIGLSTERHGSSCVTAAGQRTERGPARYLTIGELPENHRTSDV